MRELYQAIASLPSSIIWMTINYRCNISMYSNILFPVLGTISSNFLSTKYQLNVPGINSKEYSIDEILKFQKSSEDPTLLLARGVSSSTLLSLGMDKIALMDKLKLDKEEFDSFIEYASILREFNSKVSNQNQITKIKINYNGVNIGVEQNKTLVISKILLKKINKEEFKRAILAHEMQHVSLGHVTDGSNFIMMLLSQKVFNIALKGALFSVSDFLVKSIATKQIITIL